MNASTNLTGFATIRMRLRAPRVAIVFRGDKAWQYWCRLAIHAASRVWGGVGFVLIPYSRGGQVHPKLLQAARAYDPDYVLLLQMCISQYESAYPGELPIARGGNPVTGENRTELVNEMGREILTDADGEKARNVIVEACNAYRRRMGGDGDFREQVTLLNPMAPGDDRALTLISQIPGIASGSRLSCPENWTGSIGVSVAARCGAIETPIFGEPPDLEGNSRRQLLRWLFGTERAGKPDWQMVWHEAAAVSVDETSLDTAFNSTAHGLVPLRRLAPTRSTIVTAAVGDTAEDFSLAFAWDRIYGRGIWIPSDLSPIGESEDASTVRDSLASIVSSLAHRGGKLRLITTSESTEALNAIAESLQITNLIFSSDEDRQRHEKKISDAVTCGDVAFDAIGIQQLAVDEDWDQQYALPVIEDQDGSRTMMTPPPAPEITHADLASCRSLRWQVDIDFLPSGSPRGRGFDGHDFIAPEESVYMTWVRSGRDGISFESHRWDFLDAGSPRLSQLARPRLRDLALIRWASCLAEQKKYSIKYSDAGLRVNHLSRLWGSRIEMVDTVAGEALPVLRSFVPDTRRSSDAYPNGEGVVLLTGVSEGYLTFEGMVRIAEKRISIDKLRTLVDILLARGLMSRGLVLSCATCNRPSFIKIDALSQTNPCPRCGSVNDLKQEHWRHPYSEPCWYYDLHPIVRELLRSNGEVPLLLSRYLRSKYRHYVDTPEFEICKPSGEAVAEADLLGICDEKLVVAEAKRSSSLGTGRREIERSAFKRIRLADVLGADELILATSREQWDKSTLSAVCAARERLSWDGRDAPTLRVITGLGGASVTDELLP